MAFVGNIIARVGADISGFQKNMAAAQKTLEKTGAKLRDIGSNMSTYLTLPIGTAAAASIKLASDMEESMNKVKVAFKNSADSVLKFSDSTLKTYGISKGAALDMTALFGDMGTAMGQTPAEAAKMSMSLVGLAGDLASFKNIGIDQATDALKGVFTGEGDALTTLGIVMQDSTLEAYALANGFKKSYDDMSQAEKVALRYAFVMSSTKNAQGDFARTQDGAANQMRIFQESMKELGAQLGEIMLPIFTAIVTKVNEVASWFQQLDGVSKTIIITIGLIVAAIGPLIWIVGGLITSFGVVSGAIAAISSPVLITIGVIAALVAAFAILWNTNEGFRKFIISAWEQIKVYLVIAFQYIQQVATVVWMSLKAFWEENQTGILAMFQQIWAAIWAYLNLTWNQIKTVATAAFNALKIFWQNWGTNVIESFKIIWDTLKAVFVGAIQIITGLFKILEGIFTGDWSKIMEGFKDIFIGAFKVIVGAVKGYINTIINALNAFIKGLNKISLTAPDWVPGLGGKSFSINIPQIPLLANGGLVTGPTLAMIGEAGNEAVIPLDNTSVIDNLAGAIGSAMLNAMKFNGGSKGGAQEIAISIDSTKLARIIIPAVRKEEARIGDYSLKYAYE